MSDLIVKVVVIDEVLSHPNAEKLEVIRVGGWQIVSGKGNYVTGQTAIHIPPEVMVPKELADKWAVTPYLSWKKDAMKGCVKCVRLRGEPSFGFLAPNETGAEVGTNLAEHYGIEKYEEPEPSNLGQMARNHPFFHKYTDIQNLRNYPDELPYNEPLRVMEKLHGTNSRVGWVRVDTQEDPRLFKLEKVIGTHRTQRKLEDPGVYGLPFQLYGDNLYKVLDRILQDTGHPGIEEPLFLESLIFFGEIYGPGIQDLTYGSTDKAWRLFDIAVNGKYLPWDYVIELCRQYGIPMVPCLEPAIFTFQELCELAEGSSALSPGQIKEGIVVRPLFEQTWGRDLQPKRMIFKVISSDYLTRKGGTERH